MPPRLLVLSHRRPATVLTHLAIAGVELSVPEAQVGQYAEHHDRARIIPRPDSVVGISATRQWALERFGDVAMLDDDIEAIVRLHQRGLGEAARPRRLTPEEARDRIFATAETAAALGTFLYSFAVSPNPMLFNGNRPFRFGPFARGALLGILPGSSLRWPNEQIIGEDEWVSLQCAYHHRFMLIDTRFGVSTKDPGRRPGGCAEFRTEEVNRFSTEVIRKAFGSALRVEERSGSLVRKALLPYKV